MANRHSDKTGGAVGSRRRRTRPPLDRIARERRVSAATRMPAAPLRRRRIGVMGGTFDPIHHGHLVAASEVQQQLRPRRGHLRAHRAAVDEAGRQPGRAPLPDDGDRHRVQSAVHGEPRRHRPRAAPRTRSTPCETCGRSIRMPTSSSSRGPTRSPRSSSGKTSTELWELAHFVAVSRPGHALSIRGLPEQGVSSLEVPALAISSTDCRRRVDRGFPVWYLVPDGVVQYISKHHLYRSRT